MPTEQGGAARRDGVQRAMLSASQTMRAPIVRAVGPDDIGEVDSPRSLRADARGGGRRRRHGSGGGRLRQIQGGAGREHAALTEVEIPHGRGDVPVPEEALHGVEVFAGLEQAFRIE